MERPYVYRTSQVEVRVPPKMAGWPFGGGQPATDPNEAAQALKRASKALSDALINPEPYRLDEADQERLRAFADGVGRLSQMVAAGRSFGAAKLAAQVAADSQNIMALLKMARQQQVQMLSRLISRITALAPVAQGLARGQQAPQKPAPQGGSFPMPQPPTPKPAPSMGPPITEQDIPPAG